MEPVTYGAPSSRSTTVVESASISMHFAFCAATLMSSRAEMGVSSAQQGEGTGLS